MHPIVIGFAALCVLVASPTGAAELKNHPAPAATQIPPVMATSKSPSRA